ncbi:MAG: nucleotidyltransferase [Patescibacteria group bacterium]|nr:nucleotidyltransferase [Patescibacteria group bacterium]MDE2015040.1 nucleotidyltransferase [Patescibacteria group bacterium]MDE2226468.1 nucleotidyltransferase [Patescibacteria group bacterium]
MTQDQYFDSILARHNPVPLGFFGSPLNIAIDALTKEARAWGGHHISNIGLSGSYAKGTAISGQSDVDLFISLHHNVIQGNVTLKDVYESLYNYLKKYGAQKQNVSLHIKHGNVEIDLVPAVRQNVLSSDHSLWSNRKQTWLKTNVLTHINTIKSSGRNKEIRATKIWRKLHGLDFPSLYLELSVIEALSNQYIFSFPSPADNFLKVLDYFQGSFLTAKVVDPANTNNAISDDLTFQEKQSIARQAKISRSQPNWSGIIW